MSKITVKEFERLHDQLLTCYAKVFPSTFMWYTTEVQKDFCAAERRQLENVFIHNRIGVKEFFDDKLPK